MIKTYMKHKSQKRSTKEALVKKLWRAQRCLSVPRVFTGCTCDLIGLATGTKMTMFMKLGSCECVERVVKCMTNSHVIKNRFLVTSQCMRFPTMCYVRPAKPQISLRICAV